MYINFQQNWVNRSVKTVSTNIFAKNCKLHKFARAIPIIMQIFKNQLLQTCITIKRTCMSIFSKIGLIDQSKPCTQICLQKIIRISKNHPFRHALPHNRHSGQFWDQRLFKLDISIGLLDIKLPRKDIDTDERTEKQTDGRKDRHRVRQQ